MKASGLALYVVLFTVIQLQLIQPGRVTNFLLLGHTREDISASNSHELRLDPHGILRDEVVEIRHLSELSAVEVKLRGQRCPRPVLRGRLSGPALVMLEWKQVARGGGEESLFGYYRAPSRGVYFLEIIVLYCFQFQKNWSQALVQNTCIEDVRRHRLTSQNVTIQVLVTQHNEKPKLGYWERTDHFREGIYTRTQPNGCVQPLCNIDEFTRRQNVSSYKFSFNETALDASRFQTSVLCFVGASHSRFAVGHLQAVFPSYSAKIEHIEVQFPSDLQTASSSVHASNCTHVIIGIGQWPAGWPGGAPTSFSEYESSMKIEVANFSAVLRKRVPSFQIFIRSMHENPLGNLISACPPGDWRNPEVVRIYNEILLSVSEQLSIPFLDTTDIIMPLWDSAADWCHYEGEAGRVDALYLAHRALAHVL